MNILRDIYIRGSLCKIYVELKYKILFNFWPSHPYNFLRRILRGIDLYKKIRIIPFKKNCIDLCISLKTILQLVKIQDYQLFSPVKTPSILPETFLYNAKLRRKHLNTLWKTSYIYIYTYGFVGMYFFISLLVKCLLHLRGKYDKTFRFCFHAAEGDRLAV